MPLLRKTGFAQPLLKTPVARGVGKAGANPPAGDCISGDEFEKSFQMARRGLALALVPICRCKAGM